MIQTNGSTCLQHMLSPFYITCRPYVATYNLQQQYSPYKPQISSLPPYCCLPMVDNPSQSVFSTLKTTTTCR